MEIRKPQKREAVGIETSLRFMPEVMKSEYHQVQLPKEQGFPNEMLPSPQEAPACGIHSSSLGITLC